MRNALFLMLALAVSYCSLSPLALSGDSGAQLLVFALEGLLVLSSTGCALHRRTLLVLATRPLIGLALGSSLSVAAWTTVCCIMWLCLLSDKWGSNFEAQ